MVRTVADELARLFGFKLPEMNWDSVNDAAAGVGDLTDELGDAAENAKELKNSLLGIDEINRLSDGSRRGERRGERFRHGQRSRRPDP